MARRARASETREWAGPPPRSPRSPQTPRRSHHHHALAQPLQGLQLAQPGLAVALAVEGARTAELRLSEAVPQSETLAQEVEHREVGPLVGLWHSAASPPLLPPGKVPAVVLGRPRTAAEVERTGPPPCPGLQVPEEEQGQEVAWQPLAVVWGLVEQVALKLVAPRSDAVVQVLMGRRIEAVPATEGPPQIHRPRPLAAWLTEAGKWVAPPPPPPLHTRRPELALEAVEASTEGGVKPSAVPHPELRPAAQRLSSAAVASEAAGMWHLADAPREPLRRRAAPSRGWRWSTWTRSLKPPSVQHHEAPE